MQPSGPWHFFHTLPPKQPEAHSHPGCDAARHLGDVLARVKHAGESFLLNKSDKPLARLVPLGPRTKATGADIMKALTRLPHDPDFADDLERVNRMDRAPKNPWA